MAWSPARSYWNLPSHVCGRNLLTLKSLPKKATLEELCKKYFIAEDVTRKKKIVANLYLTKFYFVINKILTTFSFSLTSPAKSEFSGQMDNPWQYQCGILV